MKKILSIAAVAVLSLGLAQAADDADGKKGKGKGKGKGDPAARAAMILKKADTDGNGTLSKEEFAATPMAKKMEENKPGLVDKAFADRDKNEDGELDKGELAAPRGGKGKGSAPKGKGKGKGKGKDAE